MMRTKLHYPKMGSTHDCPGGPCIAFEKYDGTNVHWSWNRELGWHAFGTRRDEFELDEAGIAEFTRVHAHIHESVALFQAHLADGIAFVFEQNPNYRSFTNFKAFTEFLGPNSFAGLHQSNDPKELWLFDVWVECLGFVNSRDFVKDFECLPIARVVYDGKLTGKFAEDVRTGKYGVKEGVVCKGGRGSKQWMAKIKTYAYMERLKQAFANNWEQYWE